jgi:hypothetical protein
VLLFYGDSSMRFVAILVAVASMFMANVAFATPDCRPCPYSCSDLGLGKKDCSVVSDTRGVCCLDLTQKGLELAKAQASVIDRNPARQDQCPAGFRPSEQKCSVEERRRGCKDMRLPSGLGCVKR